MSFPSLIYYNMKSDLKETLVSLKFKREAC